MASLASLKINSYIFIGLLVLVFAMFMSAIVVILQMPFWFFIILTFFIVLFQIAISSTIVRWTTGTRILKPGENPYLEKVVGKLAREAGVPIPKLGMVNDPTPNAFVFGITQGGSTLSVHRGLLEQLNDKEIEAVLGHEVGHIRNRDCMYMTFLSVIPLIAYMGMRMLFYARFGRSKNAGAIILIGLVSLIVYFLSSLLIKRLSRIREYYADAYSGYITKDPQSLASALTKITYGLSLAPEEKKSQNAARSFYIGDVQNAHKEMDVIRKNASKYDLDGDGVIDDRELELAMEEEAKRKSWDKFAGLFSTHPPTFKRILALKEMQREMQEGRITDTNIYDKVEF
ncbi:MAG: M48 family metalloprotease [Thermoplasmatota archaeon]